MENLKEKELEKKNYILNILSKKISRIRELQDIAEAEGISIYDANAASILSAKFNELESFFHSKGIDNFYTSFLGSILIDRLLRQFSFALSSLEDTIHHHQKEVTHFENQKKSENIPFLLRYFFKLDKKNGHEEKKQEARVLKNAEKSKYKLFCENLFLFGSTTTPKHLDDIKKQFPKIDYSRFSYLDVEILNSLNLFIFNKNRSAEEVVDLIKTKISPELEQLGYLYIRKPLITEIKRKFEDRNERKIKPFVDTSSKKTDISKIKGLKNIEALTQYEEEIEYNQELVTTINDNEFIAKRPYNNDLTELYIKKIPESIKRNKDKKSTDNVDIDDFDEI